MLKKGCEALERSPTVMSPTLADRTSPIKYEFYIKIDSCYLGLQDRLHLCYFRHLSNMDKGVPSVTRPVKIAPLIHVCVVGKNSSEYK